jgi:hypothetical protein
MAGRKGRCPNCSEVVLIPQRLIGPSSKPAGKLPVARPLAQTTAKSPEPEIVELEEFVEEPKSTPTPAPVSGLTPLGPLVPIPAPVPGLTPIAPELLTSLPPAARVGAVQNPFAAASDPYASPAYAGGYSHVIDDSRRRGLSWEREPSLENFTDTLNEVLGASQDPFRRMRRTGGVANPLMFFVIGMVISQIANAIYATVYSAVVLASRGGPFPFEALVIVAAVQLVGGLIGVVVFVPILAFIIAGIYHVLLAMIGGANAGYEATLRCVCFTYGSTAVLNAIPVIGPIIGFFYGIVVLIQAFSQAHETSGSKASFAVLVVLLPILLCGCAAGVLMGISAMNAAG